jgi:zeaxanthin glucosyltransferase
MSRILITSFAAKGHINPILGVAELLARAGHTMIWLPRPVGSMTSQPAVPGIEVRQIDWDWLPPGKVLDFAGAARDFTKYVEFNIEARLNCVVPLVPRYRQVIREFKPDIIVMDGQIYPAVIAAYCESVPQVSLMTSPAGLISQVECDLTNALREIASYRREIFAGHGMMSPSFAGWDYMSTDLNIAFLPQEMLSEAAPSNIMMAGPSIQFERMDDPDDFPWDKIVPGRPLVYVSFGTLYYGQPDLFRIITDAAAGLDVQLVATMGALVDTPFINDLPGNTLAVRYTPQLHILKQAAVCISHGGANTISEALYYGVPQLVVPLCTDQPINAYLIDKAGAGISIPPPELTTENCRNSLIVLLDLQGRYKKNASRLSEIYQANNGAQAAADRITEMLSKRSSAGEAATHLRQQEAIF